MKKLLIICFFEIIIYCGLFILRPATIVESPNVWIWTLLPIVYFLVVCSYACVSYLYKFRYWILGVPIMWLLISLYHPSGIYDLSDSSFVFSLDYKFDWSLFKTDALWFSLMLLGFQLILLFIIKIFGLQKVEQFE